MRTVLSLSVVLFFVAGCGGGSGEEATGPPPAEQPPVVEAPDTPDPETTYCYSTDRETLIAFLQDAVDGRIVRWTRQPVLRMAEGTPSRERRIVREVVGGINTALPDEYDIVIGSDAPALSGSVPDGEIYVDFAPPREWVGRSFEAGGSAPIGWADTTKDTEIRHSHVWIQSADTIWVRGRCDEVFSYLVAHELLHAMGFGHVSRWEWRSNMFARGASALPICTGTERDGTPFVDLIRQMGTPGTLDKDGLRAIYSLDNGDYPEELRIESGQECE